MLPYIKISLDICPSLSKNEPNPPDFYHFCIFTCFNSSLSHFYQHRIQQTLRSILSRASQTKNLEIINQYNKNRSHSFHLSPYHFLSLRNDQFYSIYTTTIKRSSNHDPKAETVSVESYDQTSIKGARMNATDNTQIQNLLLASKSPSINIDLTNFTTPVKNQGKWNSCYAHSAIATVEALLYKKYNQIFDHSEQHIFDCTRDWAPPQHNVYNKRGCVGGWGWISYEYLKGYGVTFEEDYPYRSKITGTERMCRSNYITSKTFRVKDYQHFYNKKNPQSQYNKLNSVLLQGKTLAVSIQVPTGPAFQFYGSSSPGINIWNLCGPFDDVNHELQLVGSTDQYWKVKNSFGPKWGEKGFLYLDKSKGLNCINICLDFVVSSGLAEDNSQ